ncbi:hypothetical protein [Massilibacterium senegalense]|uniref:hypothetical protein n=1 Tax=Massilibacterium senegalense TaxID=1632858 RepID=UPI0007865A7A|nr:hypothetical protein [Massilibacterium senegalense]
MKRWSYALILILLLSMMTGCSEEVYTEKTNESFEKFVKYVYDEATSTQKNVKETINMTDTGEYSSVKASNQIGIAVTINDRIAEDMMRNNYVTKDNEKEYTKLKTAIEERKKALALIQGYYDENMEQKEWLEEGVEILDGAYNKIAEVHESIQK